MIINYFCYGHFSHPNIETHRRAGSVPGVGRRKRAPEGRSAPRTPAAPTGTGQLPPQLDLDSCLGMTSPGKLSVSTGQWYYNPRPAGPLDFPPPAGRGVRPPLSRLLGNVATRGKRHSKADLCQDPKKIQEPGSAGSKIWDPGGSWIQQLRFCRGIQGILDPALQILQEILWILDPALQIL